MHLPGGVLEEVAERAVQDAGRAPSQGCRVAAAVEPFPGGLDADQLDVRIIEESREDAHRVRSAADARHDRARQASGPLEHLCACLTANDRLKFLHHAWIGGRTHDRPDDVMAGSDVGDPVADGFRRGVLERARPAQDWHDLGPHQPHAEHVQLLAAHVLRAHVHDAFQPETGTNRRRRNAVLAGPGFGDDPALAHPPRQEGLADGVVDLVGARVVEVLPLEIDRRAHPGGEMGGGAER